MQKKWFAIIPPYLAVWVGLFFFHSAWGALLGFHIAIVFVLFLLKPKVPLAVLFKPVPLRSIVGNVFLCSAGGLGLYLLWNFLVIQPGLINSLNALGLNGVTWFGFITYFSLVNPIIEEYFWRGALGSETRSFYIGDLAYAGYHVLVIWEKTQLYTVLMAVATLTLIGWVWRQVYRRDGSLLTPILGHMVADFSILLAVYLKVR
jgi:membrane protease YdiL (CAAX protease family)